MITIGSQLDRHRGIGPGFDFLRIFLAFAIVAWHSRNVVYWTNDPVSQSSWWFIEYSLVPTFFALSGFLVAASGIRLSLKNFLINRGLRILPALALEILFSAFLLGPLFTSLSWRAYFSSPLLYHYLTNMVGLVNFYLPGVFDHHPWTMVNGALWTIPYEMICYALLSLLIITRWLGSPRAIATCTLVLMLLAIGCRSLPGLEATYDHGGTTAFDKVVRFFLTGEQSRLLVSFMMGIVFYGFRHRIPYNFGLLVVAAAACLIIAVEGRHSWMDNATLRLISIPALTYLMAFIGVTAIPVTWPFTKGDYSYGVYLYHLPFQQMLYGLFPSISALQLFVLSVPTCTLVAAFSWHVVEKPVLRLRKRFSFVASVRGVTSASSKPGASVAGKVEPDATAQGRNFLGRQQ